MTDRYFASYQKNVEETLQNDVEHYVRREKEGRLTKCVYLPIIRQNAKLNIGSTKEQQKFQKILTEKEIKFFKIFIQSQKIKMEFKMK